MLTGPACPDPTLHEMVAVREMLLDCGRRAADGSVLYEPTEEEMQVALADQAAMEVVERYYLWTWSTGVNKGANDAGRRQ